MPVANLSLDHPAARRIENRTNDEGYPKEGDKSDDEAHDRDTQRVAHSAARAAQGGEGTHAAQRRAGAAAAGAAVGSDRQRVPIRDGEGSASVADLFRGRSQLLVYHFM